MIKNKRGLEAATVVSFIIALVILAITVGIIMVAKDKGFSALEFIRNLFRFGR